MILPLSLFHGEGMLPINEGNDNISCHTDITTRRELVNIKYITLHSTRDGYDGTMFKDMKELQEEEDAIN